MVFSNFQKYISSACGNSDRALLNPISAINLLSPRNPKSPIGQISPINLLSPKNPLNPKEPDRPDERVYFPFNTKSHDP